MKVNCIKYKRGLKKNDSHIIDCLKQGKNNKVLETLYTDVYPKVKAYVLSNSGSDDDAIDVFQDAIVILCKQINKNRYDIKHDIAAFLYSVSRNLWINKAKREKRMKVMPKGFDFGIEVDYSNEILTKPRERALNNIIELLGEKCHELLQLSVYQRRTSDEICEIMGFSTYNAVKTQKYKCKKKLAEILDKYPSLREAID